MTDTGRVAVALLVFLVLGTLWRTSVRAGGRDSRSRSGIGGGYEAHGDGEYVVVARHLEQRVARTRRLLEERPHDSRLLLRLANLHYQRAYGRALDAFEADPAAARRLEEGDDRPYREWMRKTLAHDTTGDLRESARAARAGLAVERDPERRWELLRSLARTECARGAHDRELTALEEGGKLRPGDPEVLSRLARAYGETGNPLAVEETLEQAWRRARRRQQNPLALPEPALSATAVAGRDDRQWASSAHDGDEWLSGLCLRSP